MSISAVNYKPHVYTPAYNPIPYSITSNENGQTDFSYVFDLYVNGATGYTYRLKQRPNPAGAGMIDISPIMQSYVELSNWTAEQGWGKNFRNFSEICPVVEVKAGEEYIGTNGQLTIFDGSGATGAPAYNVYPAEANVGVRATPGAFDFTDQQDHLSDYLTDYGYFDEYLMDGDGKFLKRQGNNITIQDNDVHTLSFINWIDTAATYSRAVQGINIEYFNASGSISSTFIQNITSNGGGPMTAANYTSISFDKDYVMMAVNVGTRDLSLPVGTTYYEVTPYYKDNATAATTPDAVAGETVTFTLDTNCNDLYPPVRLSWLNDLGGRDYYNFTMKYERTSRSQETEYYQSVLDYTALKPVKEIDDDPNYQNWLRGGNKSFNKTVTQTYRIESDWVTQEDVDFLGAIPESPSVWGYIDGATNPVTVKVNNLDYTYKFVKQEKLVQASFDLTFTKVQQKQTV